MKTIKRKRTQRTVPCVLRRMEDSLSGLDGTLTVGINLSGSFGIWDYNYQIGISLDFKGNITIQSTKVTGLTTGDSYASVGLYAMITNAPTTHDLNGMGYQFGGTVGIPSQEGLTASIGGEFNVIDTGNSCYYGATGMLGITTTPGGEFHAEFGSTREVCSFNIFHAIHSLIQ